MSSNGRLAGYDAMVSRMNLTDPSQKAKLAPCPCRLFAALRMSSGSLALTQDVPLADRESARMLTFMNPGSNAYGRLVGLTDMPTPGDELHHFGWNACSSCLCPYAPHPHMERRYLVVPGINSSRIHILDTKPDPRQPRIVKTIEAETLARRTGYAAPHTVHCGPEAIYMSALGAPDGNGPGGTFVLDPETFDVNDASLPPEVERFHEALTRLIHAVGHEEPLVDGEGKFGVRNGTPEDRPVHPYYTACRLTRLGEKALHD